MITTEAFDLKKELLNGVWCKSDKNQETYEFIDMEFNKDGTLKYTVEIPSVGTVTWSGDWTIEGAQLTIVSMGSDRDVA